MRKGHYRKRFWILCLLAAAPALSAPTAQSLYDEAVIKETGERDPDAALDLYRQAIDKAGTDHKLAYNARLHSAACLERLGKSQDAQAVYAQIVSESAAAPADTVQAAQANLDRLQAQEQKASEEANRAKPMVLVPVFQESRLSFLAGPALSASGSKSFGDLSLALRCRLSPQERAFALWGEMGGFIPFGSPTLEDQAKSFNAVTDNASLKLKSQFHLAMVAELPHGKQNQTIPEMGIGASLTSSNIDYASASSQGSQSSHIWSPFLTAGLRLWADQRASLLLQGAYTANPYAKSVDVPAPAHTQTFDFPTSLWSIQAQVVIKLGTTKTVMKPKE